MEAFESSAGVVTHPGPRDKYPRYTRVATLEIDCRMPGQTVDGGHILGSGKSTVTVPGRSVDAIMALAWDDQEQQRIDAARDRRDALIEGELREEFHPEMNVPQFREEIARVRAKAPDERDEREEALLAAVKVAHTKTRHSIESCFFEQHHRGIHPFRSVKILKDDQPLPEEESKLMHDKAQLGSLVQLLQQATSGTADISALKNEIAELRELVEIATAPAKKKQ